MLRIIAAVGLIFTTVIARGAEGVVSRLDRLVSEGNRAYELSLTARIAQCVDSISILLNDEDLGYEARTDYGVSLLKLRGNLHYELERFDSAEICYGQARRMIAANPYVDFHGNDLLMLREMAQLRYRVGDYAGALELMDEVDETIEYDAPYRLGDADWLLAKMARALCMARLGRFAEAVRIGAQELESAIDKDSEWYAKALRMYGKILLLADADRVGALNAYRQYFDAQKRYAAANFMKMDAGERSDYWHTLRPFVADCFSMEDADAAFLYDVALFTKGLLLQLSTNKGVKTGLDDLGCRWTDVRNNLREGEMAIEFIEYERLGHRRMCALTLARGDRPRFIALPSPEVVDSLGGLAMTSADRSSKDRLYDNLALQRAVWPDQLLGAVAHARRIYFAPDGYQHRLALEYMPQVAHKEMFRLTSTRRLRDGRSGASAVGPMLAMGAVNYDLDRGDNRLIANDSIAYRHYRGSYFPRLRPQSDETRDVAALRANRGDTTLRSSWATETAFRELAPRYANILLSTHGHFDLRFAADTDLKSSVGADNSLSLGVLALSGANTLLADREFDHRRRADGLLSAAEIATLDLAGCRLFTASACRSGLGQITPDGIYGLQRALKNAGVKAMLLSLWDVSSDAAAELMKHFYGTLNKGATPWQALRAARNALLQTHQTEVSQMVFDPATLGLKEQKSVGPGFDKPQFANAFVLIDSLE